MNTSPESSVRLVSAVELSDQARDAAVWASLQTHDEVVKGKGAWDPEVWQELERPTDPDNPPKLFLLDTISGRARLVPHIGATSLAS